MDPDAAFDELARLLARLPADWLYPPLPEATLAAFEQRHRVRLPPDYRRFLAELGNGGGILVTGWPRRWDAGVWPLEAWNAMAGAEDTLPADYLASGSPIVPGYEPRPPEGEGDSASDDEYDRFGWRGLLPLAHEGCGWISALVVAGPWYGKMVSTDGGYSTPYAHASGFVDWFRKHVEQVLRRAGNAG